MTGGRVRLRAGTLYAALDRLRGEGLIEVDREEVVQSRLRRYYRLTGAGEQSLAAETARLREQATIAEGRLRARRADFGGATTSPTSGTAACSPSPRATSARNTATRCSAS